MTGMLPLARAAPNPGGALHPPGEGREGPRVSKRPQAGGAGRECSRLRAPDARPWLQAQPCSWPPRSVGLEGGALGGCLPRSQCSRKRTAFPALWKPPVSQQAAHEASPDGVEPTAHCPLAQGAEGAGRLWGAGGHDPTRPCGSSSGSTVSLQTVGTGADGAHTHCPPPACWPRGQLPGAPSDFAAIHSTPPAQQLTQSVPHLLPHGAREQDRERRRLSEQGSTGRRGREGGQA